MNVLKKRISLSAQNILHLTENQCNIIIYKNLANVKNIDDVLSIDKPLVILYEQKNRYGHWVVLLKTANDTLEFFDPYGFIMDFHLLGVSNDYQSFQTQYPHLTKLIHKSKYNKLIVNKRQFQKLEKNINTCGRWVSFRILTWVLEGLDLKEFTKFIDLVFSPSIVQVSLGDRKNTQSSSKLSNEMITDNDDIITLLTPI